MHASLRPSSLILAFALIAGLLAVAGCSSTSTITPPPSISTQDASFVTFAAEASNGEIALANLATSKSSLAPTQSFATRMISDHTAMNAQLAQAVNGRVPIPPPTTIPPQDQQMLTTLQSLSSPQFDRTYLAGQITDHQTAIAQFQNEAQHGTDPAIKQVAAAGVPILQTHLTLAQQTLAAVGGP